MESTGATAGDGGQQRAERRGVAADGVPDAPPGRILVSACLLGSRVRFDGRAKTVADTIVECWRAEGRLVAHCPEVAGGLPVPRPPAEIEPGGDARAVLDGRARIRTPDGDDVTRHFLAGARAALDAAAEHGVRAALLKDSSPSCGLHRVYDGTFTGATAAGPGVTTRLLKDNGIAVFAETDLEAADAHLRTAPGHPG
ncbi:DUF523 domain-containing protein [Streptomonospora salina]|uniref:Uncharacterized protein YbbK (DUF523 family) n=1 Tax=Streptomonospora salina TaxID=104205 RepID=A0A841EAM7_9ACTN|nr:DUF523 domain-containing protein [Streptomonospora salina]MBB5996521.1 uncharacterized protein YbbK (DUF523 family) [Streptomonospora salina]